MEYTERSGHTVVCALGRVKGSTGLLGDRTASGRGLNPTFTFIIFTRGSLKISRETLMNTNFKPDWSKLNFRPFYRIEAIKVRVRERARVVVAWIPSDLSLSFFLSPCEESRAERE